MKTIFIIDDDPLYLNSMSAKLNLHGYNTEVFENVLDALPALKYKPDVIFLSHHYAHSVSKGYEFIELIRLHTGNSLIVYFSTDREEVSNEHITHKADAFLKKNKGVLDDIPAFLEELFILRKKRSSLWNRLVFRLLELTGKHRKKLR